MKTQYVNVFTLTCGDGSMRIAFSEKDVEDSNTRICLSNFDAKNLAELINKLLEQANSNASKR